MKKVRKKTSKAVYIYIECVYNKITIQYGDAPDSIAGERKDKHTVDGAATIKRST